MEATHISFHKVTISIINGREGGGHVGSGEGGVLVGSGEGRGAGSTYSRENQKT